MAKKHVSQKELNEAGAASRARTEAKSNGALVSTTVDAELMAGIIDPAQLVEPITKAALEGVNIERILSLDAGQMIRGTYLGKGPKAEVTDPVTGEVREIDTHRIEARPGIVARIFDSHQLARELEGKNGERLRIMKLGQVSTKKGRRVNDYIIAVEQ